MATILAAPGGGNWSSGATWVGGVVPTAADDVVLNSSSGNVTIDVASACRSLNCTGYTGTLTHNAVTLTIGDGTAGTGNIALLFAAAMTYTIANSTTSAFTFASTSATRQTIDVAGKTTGNMSFTGVGGDWVFVSPITQGRAATVTITNGALGFAGVSDATVLSHTLGSLVSSGTAAKSLRFGQSTITVTRNTQGLCISLNASNTTLSAAQATFIGDTGIIGSRLVFNCAFPTGAVIGTLILNGDGERGLIGTFTVGTLTRNGTATYYDQLNLDAAGGVLSVTGALNLISANAEHRMTLWSSSTAVKSRLVVTGAALNFQHIDVQDITFDNGGANLDLSTQNLVADCGGNSMFGGGQLIFLPATTQTWAGGAGNWNDPAKWTSRVPLCHDNVVINSAFSGGPVISANRKWLCRDITVTGSGGVTLRSEIYETYLTGNMTWRTGITFAANASCTWCVAPRANVQWRFNSMSSALSTWNFQVGDGVLTFADDGNIGATVAYRTGEMLIPAGVTVGFDGLISNANNATRKSIFSIAGVFRLRSGSGTLFSMTNGAGFTEFRDLGGRVEVTATSANTRTLALGGVALPDLHVAPSAGTLTITGGGSLPRLPQLTTPGAATVTIAAGTTLTLRSPGRDRINNGTNVLTLRSATGGSPATMSKANGQIAADYLSVQDITFSGGGLFQAGANSTNVSGNSGISFAAARDWSPQSLMAA